MNALKTIPSITIHLFMQARRDYFALFPTVFFIAGALHSKKLPLPTTQNHTYDKTINYDLPPPSIAESRLVKTKAS